MNFSKLFPSGVALLSAIIVSQAFGQQSFPKAEFVEEPTPLASEFAEPGGKQVVYQLQYPKSFNYYLDFTVTAHRVFKKMFDTLLTIAISQPDLHPRPGIANKWTISADKKTFTFELDPEAKWSDGKPVTAHDVVWTFDTVVKPDTLTGQWKVLLSRIESATAKDARTVVFKAKEVHWSNLISLGQLYIMPKHWGEKIADFNDANFDFPVVSGPYSFHELREPDYLRLKRRDDYWAIDRERHLGLDNFEIFENRYYRERETAFDRFRKGEIDTFAVYTSNRWVNETKGEKFAKNWIIKQAVYNRHPIGFQGFAMNMRRELFKDKRVRQALAHLVDRERMNSTIMHNQYVLQNSYYRDLWDSARPCPNKLIPFDKEKARALLKEAGWEINPNTGKLEKDGKPFKFTILERNPSFTRFMLIYKEALAEVGIEAELEMTDWSGWTKATDSFEFDMTMAAWQATPFRDPEPMWHSKYANLKANSNICGVQNPKIDALIEKSVGEFDVEKRNDILREIDQLLYDETPYVLLWYIDYQRMLYWNKFGTPDQVLSKYEDEESSVPLWWHDPDAAADLEAAMKDNKALPPVDYKVQFDEFFPPTDSLTEPLQ